ncbi:type I secretion system permease/ATPase [Bosea thiooxidans]
MNLSNLKHLSAEFREFNPSISGVFVFSLFVTLMFLVPSVYMQQLYDRVMQSRNYNTLFVLLVIVMFFVLIWTAIEIVRQEVLKRVAFSFDEKISARVFDALNRQTDSLSVAARGSVAHDLNVIREFIGGSMVAQIMDCVWVPVILIAGFMFHAYLGLTLLLITIGVAILSLVSQRVSRDDVLQSLVASSQANEMSRGVMRNAEAARVMGMLPALVGRWRDRQRDAIGWQHHAAKRVAVAVNLLRFLRHAYFPLMLTVGMLLYLAEAVGPGALIAASILSSRAIGPVDAVANSWRSFWTAFQSATRVEQVLAEIAKGSKKISLPPPNGSLVAARIGASPRNRDLAILSDVTFSADPGNVVGVVGPSGSGKSTLGRILVGAWPVTRGSLSLDGYELAHWNQDELGRSIGYVPQDVELLPGTVAENIARFDPITPETEARIIEAVRLAGVQDIIGKLSDGLNTRIGQDGHVLSGGQRQRIALARAVYGSPRLVVLDEPNSNLDALGEEKLAQTIGKLRHDGVITILITHRLNMLSVCDRVLVLNSGTVHAFGERDQVLNRLSSFNPKQITARPSDTVAA